MTQAAMNRFVFENFMRHHFERIKSARRQLRLRTNSSPKRWGPERFQFKVQEGRDWAADR